MDTSSSESAPDSEPEAVSEDESQSAIREDLKGMSFEEIMQLKEQLGAKVYKEAVLGSKSAPAKKQKSKTDLKRLNKNRPREMSSRKQVPFLGAEHRVERKKEVELRDPRFDEKSGDYNIETFKKNYKFVTKIRDKEVGQLKKQLDEVADTEEKQKIKHTMQRLVNKNVEDKRWHIKQQTLKKERDNIQKSHNEGQQPHYLTKKERRAKELVAQFELLKSTGKLNKHLEKRRKKNAAKDRKRIGLD
ncbi:ribosomal RNA processing protein 36 homolog [Drosophila guanche]|uniref:rRNA biogenesis protein RRP36 n=2 Tax=Drosophila guanche TaxID=7266 RepID=A0A3B0JG37_DROGU|nr:ribosomal RNA processing protein 36 homolog [Drosophila guanche]SPP81354.1 blast:Ribosomal RNA processing protein 36 homolog [Drosophila guanche]